MFWKIIATGFGSGYSPVAPGTAGALVACGLLWTLTVVFPHQFSGGWLFPHLLVLIAVFFFLGVKSAGVLEKEWGHDPSKIVVDEMVGVWIAMVGVPFSLVNLALAFVLFRVFDIWKPLGIRRMERLGGGWGVMMDDVLAGVYALATLHLILFLNAFDGFLS
jgi:phosphatidylglycerophosphatase A